MPANGNGKDPVMVVVQLSGGNDFMHTLIPYNSPTYHDNRKLVRIEREDVLPINDDLGFNPNARPLKEMFEEGKVAIVQGIGYPNSNRSHFRGMDIWHTCEPDKVVTEGWVGKALRELDPNGEDELTGINFGVGLPRAMAVPGVPVTSVNDLDSYGLMTGIGENDQRDQALQIFKDMYAQAIGTGPVMEYLSRTGMDVLRGADRLKAAPAQYSSTVEYADTPSPRACATSPASTQPDSARASSTPATEATTPTPTRTPRIPSCCKTSPAQSATSSTTSTSTTRQTTS